MTKAERRHMDETLVRDYFKVEEIVNNYPQDAVEARLEHERSEIQGMREKEQ